MGHEAEDAPRIAESDLEQAEVLESAGMQNSLVVAGPSALLMIPVAWVLTSVGRVVRLLWNR